MDENLERFLWLAGGVLLAVAFELLFWGGSWIVSFFVGAFIKGFATAASFVPFIVASIFTIVLFGGFAIVLGAIALAIVGNVLARVLEGLKIAPSGSLGKAVSATAETVSKPQNWYLIFSGVFVVLLETTHDLEDKANNLKLPIYMVLLAVVVFTFCFTRRKNKRYKIAAFVAPIAIFLMYGWTLFAFDAQGHIHFSDSANALGLAVATVFSKPDDVLLLLLPGLIALSSFLSVMTDKREPS